LVRARFMRAITMTIAATARVISICLAMIPTE
jgi:hypothetical protein